MWLVGHTALAKISASTYAKVVVVKNEDGEFYGEKVLALDSDPPPIVMCLYVKIVRSGVCLWLPQDALTLAERSRPFYGTPDVKKKQLSENKENIKPSRKRKEHKDLVIPLEGLKQANKLSPDLNTSHSVRHVPKMLGEPENAFQQFVRRGQDVLFDSFAKTWCGDDFERDTPTETKLELMYEHLASEKEMQHYLNQCWRYLTLYKEQDSRTYEQSRPQLKTPLIHTNWCLVCGESAAIRTCSQCPACYHPACRPNWLLAVLHRKNIHKRMDAEDSKRNAQKKGDNDSNLCPSCYYGPGVGLGDIVWHKMNGCPWWPAKVLVPGSLPSCLVTRKHSPQDLPIQYYGTLNYTWGAWERVCLLVPSHGCRASTISSPDVRDALLDACDDYIRHYLT